MKLLVVRWGMEKVKRKIVKVVKMMAVAKRKQKSTKIAIMARKGKRKRKSPRGRRKNQKGQNRPNRLQATHTKLQAIFQANLRAVLRL